MAIPSPYHKLLRDQKSFFDSGATRPFAYRDDQLKRLKAVIRSYEKKLTEALFADLRKSRVEVFGTEIGFLYAEIDFVRSRLREWMRPKRVDTPLIALPSSSRIIYDPLGTVLILAPWNYPLNLLLAPLAGAIAGGNCAVLKPSEDAPQTSSVIAEMIDAAFPSNYISVVQGEGRQMLPLLMEAGRFDHIFFTGSVAAGRAVMEAAARQLIPVTLELGGKSPCIVDESAQLPKAAKRIAWGKFVNAGQTCVAPDYVLVHTSVKEELVSLLISEIRRLYGDNPAQSPDYPRMINKKRFEAVSGFLACGRIRHGGDTDIEDLYIGPGLLDEISVDDPVMQEEVFGPVLPILSYERLEDIPAIIDRNPTPLALYLFSRNKKSKEFILDKIRFGGGCINDTLMHLSNPALPFGGVGLSGMGAYHGKYSFDTFTHAKSILQTPAAFDNPARFPPYGKLREWLIRIVMG